MSGQVEAVCLLRNNIHTSLWAKQNAQMMCEGIMNSIMEEARSTLASQDQLMFDKDGPTLFFHLMNQLFSTTFSNVQATCNKLSDFHPQALHV